MNNCYDIKFCDVEMIYLQTAYNVYWEQMWADSDVISKEFLQSKEITNCEIKLLLQ